MSIKEIEAEIQKLDLKDPAYKKTQITKLYAPN